jgi:hypothetical protein
MRSRSVNHADSPAATERRPVESAPWRLCKLAAIALAVFLLPSPTMAQGVLAPGDAVVTGFSGSKVSSVPTPGADLLDFLHIDLEGPSAKIFRLGVPGAPPQGQLISVPSTLKVLAKDVGQVFAIALDDSRIPNIYLGQTSAFGVQIVGPNNMRLRKGQAGARWMPGQFGAAGGPGSIYRIDGQTGAVTLFATIPGNSGAGLGDIVFDKASRTFFVSDLDTGLIHRLDANGQPTGNFDHGIAGRLVRGLPPVADNGAQMDITSAGFDVEDPDTWGFTPPERRVWGMAVDRGRLFYAVAAQIWSIGINPDGNFAGDPRPELEIGNAADGQVIADIVFDRNGTMYLAQRGAIRGSYDYSVFAEPAQSAILRYQRDASGAWQLQEYAIGFPGDYRNATGGVTLGYGYDATGRMRRGACDRMVWSTGNSLRNNQAHAGKLVDEGALDIHGLQGNDVTLTRPQNEPPFTSYFLDYDEQPSSSEKAGHVGDVEIWQPCEGTPGFTQLLPGYPPLGDVPPDGVPPGGWVPPPGDTPTNLKLEKKAVSCWAIGQDKHRCGFLITVTNTGPGVYNDTIQVSDTITAGPGMTAIFSSPLFDACPGGPPSYTCTSLAPVLLNPWEQVTIPVRVDIPDPTVAKRLHCKVTNTAKILYAPSPGSQNTNPADDEDAATAQIPDLCEKEKTNLLITKRALSCFEIGQGQIRCGYHVRVWNTGPGTYNDKIDITDTVPPGTTAIFSGAGWACAGAGPAYSCTRNPVMLGINQSVFLVVRVDLSKQQALQMGCKVPNRVKIDYAVAPSDQNTNPADDFASALADVPLGICAPPVPLIDPVCPVGLQRVANDCLPFTPPPSTCRDGQVLSDGHCCPSGSRWNGRLCGPVVGTCPAGMGGQPPHCYWIDPPKPCPAGMRGQPPHCYWVDPPKQCPPGLRGQPPHCYWVDPPKHCPRGTIGPWPNCKRPVAEKCPSSMSGSPPNCRRLIPTACPSGSAGKPPNCRTVQVPPQLRRTFTPGKAVIPGNGPPRLMMRLRR